MEWVWAQVNRLTKGYVPGPGKDAQARLRVMLVHAHPLKGSFSQALADATQQGLEDAGHVVDRVALYDVDGRGTAFQPCLTQREREDYKTIYPKPSQDTEALIGKLREADALVMVYPTWWFNVPAVLKGFVDRTFLPGTAFRLPHLEPDAPPTSATGLVPELTNIKKIACVSTYGAPRHIVFLAGDNGRTMITRGLLPLFAPTCTVSWLGLYNMDAQTPANREAFLKSVRAHFAGQF